MSLAAYHKTVTKPGITSGEVTEFYDKWNEYDKDVAEWGFRGADIAGEGVIRHLSDNTDAYILDVAAGTGAVAEMIKKAGFTNVDALEPSNKMLQKARDKNLYKNYFNEYFNDNVKCIETSTYDVLVTAGGWTEGCLKLNSMPEMIRCVKPGGLVVLSIADWTLANVEEHKDKFEPYIESLQTQGQWQKLEQTFDTNFTKECGGFLFVFKVTKTA